MSAKDEESFLWEVAVETMWSWNFNFSPFIFGKCQSRKE